MKRRAVLAMIGIAMVLPGLRGWAADRRRAWLAPRVERGWVLADEDR